MQYCVLDTEMVHICSCAQRSKGQKTQIRVSLGCTILAQDLEALFSEMLNKCRRFFTPKSQSFGKQSQILLGEANKSLPFLCAYSTNSCYPVQNRNGYNPSWKATDPPETACVHLLGTKARQNGISTGTNQELGTQESLAFPEQTAFAHRPWGSFLKALSFIGRKQWSKTKTHLQKDERIFYCTNHLWFLMGKHKS